jgi:hypothetical protein
MKILHVVAVLSSVFLIGALDAVAQNNVQSISGAWEAGVGQNKTTIICTEKFFSVAIYDVPNKRFVGTYGGSYRLEADNYVANIEYHSINPEAVGNEYRGRFTLKKNTLTLEDESGRTQYQRLDNGTPGKLAGAWLITARIRDGQMSKLSPGARRTMKILSGTRFQWIAYNVETSEFSGTGGGTYTTQNGKYTENIEFFSRDSSRVGASLTFDYSLENGSWQHRGSSSNGQPVDEVWTKREKIGL